MSQKTKLGLPLFFWKVDMRFVVCLLVCLCSKQKKLMFCQYVGEKILILFGEEKNLGLQLEKGKH